MPDSYVCFSDNMFDNNVNNVRWTRGMRGSRGGGFQTPPPPLEFAKLNITDITGNEKN